MTINKWSNPIGALVQRKLGVVEDQARLAVYNLFSAIMARTPIRTGRFLANWNVTTGRPDYTYTLKADIGRALVQLDKIFVMPMGTFEIANGLPYGRALEYGSSKQAPQGMIRVSLAEWGHHLGNAKMGRAS